MRTSLHGIDSIPLLYLCWNVEFGSNSNVGAHLGHRSWDFSFSTDTKVLPVSLSPRIKSYFKLLLDRFPKQMRIYWKSIQRSHSYLSFAKNRSKLSHCLLRFYVPTTVSFSTISAFLPILNFLTHCAENWAFTHCIKSVVSVTLRSRALSHYL